MMSDRQLDGFACRVCGTESGPMVPVGFGPRGQLFECESGHRTMSAHKLLDMIAARLEYVVEGGEATERERDVYMIAIRRKCPWCEAEPGDNEYCVGDGSAHPWVTRS